MSDPTGITAAAAELASIAESINSISIAKTVALGGLVKLGGSKGGGGSKSREQKISIQLDKDQTKKFLEGLVVETQGKFASRSVGAS